MRRWEVIGYAAQALGLVLLLVAFALAPVGG
jgi:hypothetical protein